MPGIHVQLEGLLNMSRFAIRIERADLPKIVRTLQSIPKANIREMQSELGKVWERFTYSGLFKHEFQLQRSPPDDLAASRFGVVPQRSDQKSLVFTKLEPRLRGLDAPDALVEHLRHRLSVREATTQCSHGRPANSWPPVPLVDHGPPMPPPPPVDMFVWTSGVV